MSKPFGTKHQSDIDANIQMLSKKVCNLEYKYRKLQETSTIQRRLQEYKKTKSKHKEIGLSEAEYFMLCGYINALEWVVSSEEYDDLLQKESAYDFPYSVRR